MIRCGVQAGQRQTRQGVRDEMLRALAVALSLALLRGWLCLGATRCFGSASACRRADHRLLLQMRPLGEPVSSQKCEIAAREARGPLPLVQACHATETPPSTHGPNANRTLICEPEGARCVGPACGIDTGQLQLRGFAVFFNPSGRCARPVRRSRALGCCDIASARFVVGKAHLA